MSGDNVIRWFFAANPKPPSRAIELKRSRVRTYLYESLHRCITKHNLQEAFQLLHVLPLETTFDPYALLRFIFILIESSPSQRTNKNVIIYLEALMSKLDISKPDAFVEFLIYFIRNDRLDDAKELFNERHRFMKRKFHRSLPYVDVNVRCCEFYLNYLTWNERVTMEDVKPTFDVSTQGWLVNAIDCLKITTSNHEFFVICLLRVLLYYGFFKKAYLFMSEFQRNNPNNLGAQLMHCNLLKQLDAMSVTSKAEHLLAQDQDVAMPDELSLEQRLAKRSADLKTINNFTSNMDECFESDVYPLEEDRQLITKNLRVLEPGAKELMEMSCNNPSEKLKDLMDGLEVIREISNIYRWQSIRELIEPLMKSEDQTSCNDVRALWLSRYQRFWEPIDMMSMVGSHVSRKERKFIEETYRLLISFLDNTTS